MTKIIDNLSSIEGRKILRKIYNNLKYEKQRSSISILLILWKITTFEKQINKYAGIDVTVNMPLGLFKGSALWMEEIVNRFYFSTVNSFVYFGAAILLVLIGVRRFTNDVSIDLVIAGIIFEAALLLFMFLVMLFSPSDEISDDESEYSKADELIDEVGEIGRDFAAVVIQLEKITDKIDKMSDSQNKMIDRLGDIAKINSDAIKPNPEMINQMDLTNTKLAEFRNTLNQLKETATKLKKEEVEFLVKKELEKIIYKNIENE